MTKDYYSVLGVGRDASPETIKKAYRRLASKHHPDKAGGDHKRFQELQQAYDTLSDPQKRQAYDNPNPFSHHQGPNPFGGGGFDFQNIFDMFGVRGGFHHQQPRQRAHMTLWITIHDVAAGGRRPVSVGTPQGTSTVEIEIPRGIDDGDALQYPGIAPGGIDLVVTFRVHPHPGWIRQGLTLIHEHPLSVWDLIEGCSLPINDLLGNRLEITVQPGTQPGTTLRLKGRGLQKAGHTDGDLLIKLAATIPTDISEDLRQAIARERSKV